jgi:hypothetical protein
LTANEQRLSDAAAALDKWRGGASCTIHAVETGWVRSTKAALISMYRWMTGFCFADLIIAASMGVLAVSKSCGKSRQLNVWALCNSTWCFWHNTEPGN